MSIISGSPNATRPMTDPTGRCFISYRRSHVDDITEIVEAMLDHGVPPWQDRRDLTSQPLGPALTAALNAANTAGCLVWISDDVAASPAILEIEAPLVLERARRDPAFFAELWLADDMGYERAAEVFRPAGMVEDISASWHLERAKTVQVAADGRTVRRIESGEAMRVASKLLERRVAKLHEQLAAGEPIRLLFNAHGEAGEAFVPGFGIQINWARHFAHRFAEPAVWSGRLQPALVNVLRAVRAAAPGRAIAAEGRATLGACLALGWTFREVTDIPLSWRQKPINTVWTLSEAEVESGAVAEPMRRIHLSSRDLAVLVSVTGDVEPAVNATVGLPRFQAVLKIRPTDGSARLELARPGQATHLARLVARSIREARRELRTVERTHLFLAAPAGLAVLIGQQLNALGSIQTYEHLQTATDAVGTYRPAALLADPDIEP